MTDLRKAANMALAKLEHLWEIGIDAEFKVELTPEIAALSQALAQPEQEPVAWAVGRKVATCDEVFAEIWRRGGEEVTPLYTALPKREWVGLHLDDMPEEHLVDRSFLRGARWAEAKLQEKNSGNNT